jgi:hypothetical protein
MEVNKDFTLKLCIMKKKNISQEGKKPAFRNRKNDAKVGKKCKTCKLQKEFKKRPFNIVQRLISKWLLNKSVKLKTKQNMVDIFLGKVPLAILPNQSMPNKSEFNNLIKLVKKSSAKKYDNTNKNQKVETYGSNPFVDSTIVSGYLLNKVESEISDKMSLYKEKLSNYLSTLGFDVATLIDPLTNLEYSTGVVRRISVSKKSSVLHVDDFIRDGNMKVDFRMPQELIDKEFFQASFNILLTDGGFKADPLYVYNKFYKVEDERFCMDNGWQFEKKVVENCDVFKYQPKKEEGYVFSTSAYHDIYGGSKNADRITWSVFAIYVPSTNKVLLYN